MDTTTERATDAKPMRKVYLACLMLAGAWAVGVLLFFEMVLGSPPPQAVVSHAVMSYLIGFAPLVTLVLMNRRLRRLWKG